MDLRRHRGILATAGLLLVLASLQIPAHASDSATAEQLRLLFAQLFTGDAEHPYAWGQLDGTAIKIWQTLGSHLARRLSAVPEVNVDTAADELEALLTEAKPPEIYEVRVRVFRTPEALPRAYVLFGGFELAAVSARSGLVVCTRTKDGDRYEIARIVPVLADHEADVQVLHYGKELRLLVYGVLRGSTRAKLDVTLYAVDGRGTRTLWTRHGLERGRVTVSNGQIELYWIHKSTYPFGYTVERYIQRSGGLELIETQHGIER